MDAVGALLSTASLGGLLPLLYDWVGMPLVTLYLLASLALVFAVYSLSCFFFVDHSNSLWLKIIILANGSYCLLTGCLLFLHIEDLKALGWAYFLGELAILFVVIKIERRVLSQVTQAH